MNNNPTITVVGWETRNWRHHAKARAWCRDYGLTPLLRTVDIGTLYPRERMALIDQFHAVFTKRTEKVFLITLCQSCFELSAVDATIKQKVSDAPAFEIVQIPAASSQRPKP